MKDLNVKVLSELGMLFRRQTGARMAAPVRRMALVEEYETRLMYSADLAATGLTLAGAGQVSEQRVVDSSGEFVQAAQSVRHELLIVGAGIQDSQTLLDSLAGEGREIEVLLLDPAADSISQISSYLEGRHDIDAIHILSHGAQGQLALGGSTLDSAALAARADEISGWSNALASDADLLLYGCDVAAGQTGLAFVSQLALLTGSDVAASTDITGNQASQNGVAGNWILEVQTGHIETANVFSDAARQNWSGSLEMEVYATSVDVQTAPAVAINDSGAYVVTWTTSNDGSGTGIMMQRYNANGTANGAPVAVNTQTIGDQVDSAVAMANDGSFVVVWSSKPQGSGDNDGTSIQGQRFSNTGARLGAQFLVNHVTAGDQDLPAIDMADNGDFVVAWQNSDPYVQQVVFRRFSASGNPQTLDIKVDDSTTSGQQQAPAVVLNNNGIVVVTWQSNANANGDAIYARMFGSDSNPLGAKFMVNTDDVNDQRAPAISADSAGNFVISWTSYTQTINGQLAYAQRFDANGNKLGGAIGGPSGSGSQSQTSVAVMGNGIFNLVATLSDGSGSADQNNIARAEFYADGTLKYGPVTANVVTAGDQSNGVIAVNKTGAMVVVWQGNGFGDRQGIYLRRYLVGNNEGNAVDDTNSVGQTGSVNSTGKGVLANDTDGEGETLTVVQIIDAAGNSFLVDAGGVTVNGKYGTLFIRANGSYTYNANAAYLAAGDKPTDVFTYFASDGHSSGTAATLTITVIGANDAPTAVSDIYAMGKGGTITFGSGSLLANDVDPDNNDVLVVSAVDGNASKVGNKVNQTYGWFTINADGSFTYEVRDSAVALLAPGFFVSDAVSYTIRDSSGALSTATVTILIRNMVSPNDPGAQANSYSTLEDMPLVVGTDRSVLNNDTPAYNDDQLHAVLVSTTSNGTLKFNDNGTFVYTPNSGFSGTDTFSYRASNGSRSSPAVQVTITVEPVNHAPVAVADNAQLDRNSGWYATVSTGLLANDQDVDKSSPYKSESLRVASFRSTSGGSANSVAIAAGGSMSVTTTYGTLTVSSDGAYNYVSNGAASMALSNGQISHDVFSYTMVDSGGKTSSALLSITIAGINSKPVISGTSGQVQATDKTTVSPFTGIVISDPEGQNMTVTVQLDLAGKGILMGYNVGSYNAGTGIYTVSGSGTMVTNALRTLVFKPAENRVTPGLSEITTFTITASDGVLQETNNSTSVQTSSVNDNPLIGNLSTGLGTDDRTAVAVFANVTFADPDTTTQPYTVVVSLDNAVKGTLENLGGFVYDSSVNGWRYSGTLAQVQAATRGLMFRPTANRIATDMSESAVLSISLTDSSSGSNTGNTSVQVLALNDAPTIGNTSGTQTINDTGTAHPFASVTIADPDTPVQTLTVRVLLDDAAKGKLITAGYGSYDIGTGIWTYSGTADNATLAVRSLLFAPTVNRVNPGDKEVTILTIEVNDGTETSTVPNGNTRIESVSVNDLPVISNVPGAQGTNDTTGLYPFPDILVTDADRPGQTINVTVTLVSAALGTLSGALGSYDGATGTYTYSGSAEQVTAALKTLYFTPAENRVKPGDAETALVKVEVNDGGGPVSRTTSVTIVSVNDAPTVTGTQGGLAMNDQNSGVPMKPFANVSFDDLDRPMQTLTVSITLDQAAKGMLSGAASGAYNGITGVYTVSGTAAQVSAAVRSLVFTPTDNRVTPGTFEDVTLTILVKDPSGGSRSNGDTVIRVTSVNDAPVIAGTSTHAIGDNQTVKPFAGIQISDADNPQQMLALQITLDDAARGGFLNPAAGTYDDINGVYSLSGTADQLNAALNDLVFTPRSNHLAPGSSETVVLRIDVSDGSLSASANTATTVTVTAVNDKPVISGAVNVSVDDNAFLHPFGAVIISDADGATQVLTVTVTLDTLAHGSLSGFGAGSYDATTGVYTVSASASDVTAALQGLVFTPLSNRLAPGDRDNTGMRIDVSDGYAGDPGAHVSIVVETVSINDAPVLSIPTTSRSTDDKTAVLVMPDVTIADADRPDQQLTVTVTLDVAAKGSLASKAGGSFDAGSGIYTFNGTASQATAALRALTLTPAANGVTPGDTEMTSLRIAVSDGQAMPVSGLVQVGVLSVNDAPVLSGVVAKLGTGDNQALTPFAGVSVDDVDRPGQPLSVSVSLDRATLGTLSNLSGGSYDRNAGVYTFSGSAAQITAALRALVFTPVENLAAPGNTDTVQLALRVSDGVAAAVNNSTSIAILSINNAPVAQNLDINGATNQGKAIAITLAATDVDDAVVSFTLMNLPANGVLSLDAAGTRVLAAGARLTALGNASTLYFTPTANWGGTTQFGYVATDQSGASSLMQAVVQVIMVAPPPSTNVADIGTGPKATAAPAGSGSGSGSAANAAPSTPAEAGAVKVAIQEVALAPVTEAVAQLVTENAVVATAPTAVERISETSIGTSAERAVTATVSLASLAMPTAGMLTGQVTQNVFESSMSPQTRAAVENSTEAPEMIGSLDKMRDTAKIEEVKMEQMVESSVAASTAVTVGYVLWLLRGGVLAASMLSALPAWRFVDPLPVLGGLKNGDEGEDDSLEKLVEKSSAQADGAGEPDAATDVAANTNANANANVTNKSSTE